MSDLPQSRPLNQARRTLTAPSIIAAVFLGLHLVPLFWRPDLLWGADFLRYMPAPSRGLFTLLAVLLFVPRFRLQCRAWARSVSLSLWEGGRRVWITRTLVLILALAAFVALPSATHFLGDGYTVLDKLNAAAWHDAFVAPLTYALIDSLHGAGSRLWQSADNTYRVYSCASGILYVLLAFPVAAAIGKSAMEKSVVLAFLLTAGYLQLFFGYVENYALYMPGVLGYLLLGLRTLEGRMPLCVPALALGILPILHRAMAVFVPSILVIAYGVYLRREREAPSRKNGITTLAALLCVPTCAALFLWLSGVDAEAYLTRKGSSEFLPLFGDPGFYAQYRVFSFPHVLDFLNLQLLSAPAACMVLFLLRKGDFKRQPFLASASVLPLLFTFAAKPNIGAFRDWDIFSLPALPLTLWAVSAFLGRVRDPDRRFHVVLLFCGAAALHTVLWITMNANAAAAEARFTRQLERLTGHASATGWVTAGNFHKREDNEPAALYAYKRALDADPDNPNRWLLVGGAYRDMKRSADAIEYFGRAQELQPNHPIPYMNLGAAYSDLGQYEKAIEHTTKAITLRPDLAPAHRNLGQFYHTSGNLEKAVEHLERAVALRPNDAAAEAHLGVAYFDAGQNEKAIRHLENAIALRPRHTPALVNLALTYSHAGQNDRAIELLKEAVAIQPELAAAHANLGGIYSRIGQYDVGIQYLSRALEIQPDHPLANQNLGMAYRAQGRYAEAIEHFKKALELQSGSGDAQTYLNIGDTYYDMGQYEKAIPYFQEVAERHPNVANAHMLLGLAYRRLNRMDEARPHFEKTLEVKPDHPQAAQIRLWLEQIRE